MLLELVFLLLVILLMLNTAVVYLLAVKERGREEAYEAIKVDTGKSMRESQKVVPPRRPSTVGVLYVAPMRGERYHTSRECTYLDCSARDIKEFLPCKRCFAHHRGEYVD